MRYAAGGGTDVVARVDRREARASGSASRSSSRTSPAAARGFAVEYVAKEPADGYTILIGGGSELAISPLIYKTG